MGACRCLFCCGRLFCHVLLALILELSGGRIQTHDREEISCTSALPTKLLAIEVVIILSYKVQLLSQNSFFRQLLLSPKLRIT